MNNYKTDKLIETIIAIIKKNIKLLNDKALELSTKLYKIENMKIARIPHKYILKNINEDDTLLKTLETFGEKKLIEEIMDILKEPD